jgi:rhodanese-related sulfurtransferase
MQEQGSTPGGLQQRIADGKKVRIRGLQKQLEYNGKNGQIKGFDAETGRYQVKVVVLAKEQSGMLGGQETIIQLRLENIELHRDQVERDSVLTGDEIVLLGAGDAKRALYEARLDPQYWYDKAIDRVLEARNDFEVLDLPAQEIRELGTLKRQYRKISLAVHPDKNGHPQAADAFRKVYGAFETLMDARQQRRLLWILGKLDESAEEKVTFEEEEEDELFQWWWEASVPEIEKQAAEFEGQRYDDFGAMWISDGLGGNVEDVKWLGLETAKSLHREGGAIFIDCRDRPDFAVSHIEGAWCCPLPEWIEYGLAHAMPPDLISKIFANRKLPIVIYSEVATPFSRCRALCRWLLRAGHKSLKAERLRRLRGGMFGWTHKNGPVSRPLAAGLVGG